MTDSIEFYLYGGSKIGANNTMVVSRGQGKWGVANQSI